MEDEKTALKKELRTVLKNSVVTGVPELVSTRNPLKRCLRVIVSCFCLFEFFYYTLSFLHGYWQYPTVMDVVIHNPENVEIPGLTLCSYNGISASMFCELYPDYCAPTLNFTEFCLLHNYFCDKNYIYNSSMALPAVIPYDLPPINRSAYQALGNTEKDLIESCEITNADSTRSCSYRNQTKLVSVFDTMGLPNNCFAINSFTGQVSREPSYIGSKYVIALKIKANIPDSFYTSTPSATQISIHNPREIINPFKKGFSLKPCSNYYLFVSKTVNKLLPHPYSTNCTDYEELWKLRGGHGPMSQAQCREECLLNVSLQETQCVDPLYIFYPNNGDICSHPVIGNIYFSRCTNVCYRACLREDIHVDIEEHESLSTNKKNNIDECSSMIFIAFNRMEITTFSYYPKYQSIEVFGIIGGYLGVWLGISLLAITDLLETIFIIFRGTLSYLRRRKQKKMKRAVERFLDVYHADSIGNFRLKVY